jgi:hypothetical protein
MSESIAIPHHRLAGRERGRAHHLLLGALLGMIIGALGFAIVASTVDVVGAALAEKTATAVSLVEFPARELPPEWRWEPKGVEVEHMYRQHAPARLDWIREGGAR